MLVRAILRSAGIPRQRLADDAGLSLATLESWIAPARAKRRREPQPDSLRQLAAGLRARSQKLARLADQLEAAAGGS